MSNESLPNEVVERLAANDLESLTTSRRGATCEQRRSTLETRVDVESLTVGLHGYATIYDYPYDVAGGIANGGWSETITRGACDKSIAESADVRCLFNHDGIPVARTKSGTMTLTSDDIGLLVDVPSLDRRSTVANDLAIAIERGDVDEMSFAFRVLRQEWNSDYTKRTIREVQLFDVSAVSFPANPATVVALRDEMRPGKESANDSRMGDRVSVASARAQIIALDHI